jgi:hypothetical protein
MSPWKFILICAFKFLINITVCNIMNRNVVGGTEKANEALGYTKNQVRKKCFYGNNR